MLEQQGDTPAGFQIPVHCQPHVETEADLIGQHLNQIGIATGDTCLASANIMAPIFEKRQRMMADWSMFCACRSVKTGEVISLHNVS